MPLPKAKRTLPSPFFLKSTRKKGMKPIHERKNKEEILKGKATSKADRHSITPLREKKERIRDTVSPP
jgi:hypothetical protein